MLQIKKVSWVYLRGEKEFEFDYDFIDQILTHDPVWDSDEEFEELIDELVKKTEPMIEL